MSDDITKSSPAAIVATQFNTLTAQWYGYRIAVIEEAMNKNEEPLSAQQRKEMTENSRLDWFGGSISTFILIREHAPELLTHPLIKRLYGEALAELARSPQETTLTGPLKT